LTPTCARIREIYRRTGRGQRQRPARVVDLPNGLVDVVFTIDEGDKTGVREINFVGNRAFSAGRLRDLMATTESNLLSFSRPPTSTTPTASRPTLS
jgi:outer membrane protein insertion porin family